MLKCQIYKYVPETDEIVGESEVAAAGEISGAATGPLTPGK